MIKYFHLLVLCTLLVSACFKYEKPEPIPEEPKLPPITLDGKNTIGFLLIGEVWLPKSEKVFIAKQNADYYHLPFNQYNY